MCARFRQTQDLGRDDENTPPLRDYISCTGSFVSMPEGFETASDSVKYAPKIEMRVGRFPDSERPLTVEPFVLSHTLLVDLEAVDVDGLDMDRLVKDCELIREAAIRDPEALKTIVAAFGAEVPHERILEINKVVRELGLAEDQATDAGGGFLFLLVIVAALALGGCKGCAHGKGSYRQ